MNHFSILKAIYKQHKFRLAVTYFLFTIEMLALLLRPDYFAKAADGLIEGENKYLIQFTLIHLTFIVVGYIRHKYDTRTYTAIYNSIIIGHISKNRVNQSTSKLSAHSSLVRELIDFLEFDLIYVFEALYNIFGSLIFLFLYDKKVALICVTVLVPVSLVSYFYGKNMNVLTKEKHDELEKQVDIIETKNKATIKSHYKKLQVWQVRISDKEAFNFGVMEVFSLFVMAASLYITSWHTHPIEVGAGVLIAIYLYIQNFAKGLDTIPYTVERLTNFKDIVSRMNTNDNEQED